MLGEAEFGDSAGGRGLDVGLDESRRVLPDRWAFGFALARVEVGMKMKVIVGHR